MRRGGTSTVRGAPPWLSSTPVLLVTLWLVWGTAFVFIKEGTDRSPPLVYAALRLAVAAAVTGLALLLGRSAPITGPTRRTLHRYGAVLGLINGFAFFALQTGGIALSDTGFSAVVIYTQPLIVAVLARRLLRERLTVRQATGLALGWAGVAVAGVEGLRLGSADPVGYLLLLGSAVAWAVGSLIVSAAPAELPLGRLIFLQNAYGVVPLAVLALAVGGEVEWGWPVIGSALWVGSAATAGGFALQFALLRRGQASVVSAWIFAVPVISTAVGVAVRGEPLSLGLVAGAVAVGLAIRFVTPRTAAAQPPPA